MLNTTYVAAEKLSSDLDKKFREEIQYFLNEELFELQLILTGRKAANPTVKKLKALSKACVAASALMFQLDELFHGKPQVIKINLEKS